MGLNKCPIRERLKVTQCYRCWGYGHTSRDCISEDRSGACKNCAEEGHKEAECKREPVCISCRKKGHRAGSGKCPEFKRALSRVRKEEVERSDKTSPANLVKSSENCD